MAKVTDLNGCFVCVNGDVNLIKTVVDTVEPDVTTGSLLNPRAKDIFFRVGPGFLIADFVKINPESEFKEIYFHDGEFFDEPVTVIVDLATPYPHKKSIKGSESIYAELAQIPWTDGSIDEQEPHWDGVTMVDGDNTEKIIQDIMKHPKLHDLITHLIDFKSSIVFEIENCDSDDLSYLERQLSVVSGLIKMTQPETEAEKKTRELAEEVNRICFDLFGTPAFDCNQDIIDTVEKFVINGYKKVD